MTKTTPMFAMPNTVTTEAVSRAALSPKDRRSTVKNSNYDDKNSTLLVSPPQMKSIEII